MIFILFLILEEAIAMGLVAATGAGLGVAAMYLIGVGPKRLLSTQNLKRTFILSATLGTAGLLGSWFYLGVSVLLNIFVIVGVCMVYGVYIKIVQARDNA